MHLFLQEKPLHAGPVVSGSLLYGVLLDTLITILSFCFQWRFTSPVKMSPEVALNRISPMLSPFISSVVRNGKVGLDATNCLRITDLKSGYVTEPNLYLMESLFCQTHEDWPQKSITS